VAAHQWFANFLPLMVSHEQEHLKKAKKQQQHALAFFQLLFSQMLFWHRHVQARFFLGG
jgi:hypothetical protein